VFEGSERPCPLDWLDSFCMRRFTGEAAFDDTLPVAEGEIEAGTHVDADELGEAMREWLTKKKGAGKKVEIRIEETPRRS